MRRRHALASALVFCAFASVSGCGQTPIDAHAEPVIHGTREMGYPEVVAIYWQDPSPSSMGGALCSGTVIGPHAILTAKHCVFQEPTTSGGAYVAVPVSWYYIIEGDDIMSTSNPRPHPVSEMRTTPGTNVDADVMNGNDIAILLTPDTLTVTPRGYATHDPTYLEAVTVVGFGRTHTGTPMATDSGLKYSGPMSIRRVVGSQILANGTSWTCQGDSGGPLIDTDGNVTGITSFGFDSTCLNSNSVFTNVASWTSLISDALTWAPPCMPHHEICNGIDDDCNGSIDDGLGCAALGATCTMSSECASTLCSMTGAGMICTRSCFADTMLDPCPSATHCEVHSCGSGLCVPGAVGAGAPGDACTADTDCADGYCAVLQGRHICGRNCWPAGGTGCADPLACNLGGASDPLGTECGACIPAAQQMGPQPLGSTCTSDVNCGSMHCAATGHYCTEACTTEADCPSAWHCNGTFCAPGPLGLLGAQCTTGGDCSTAAPDCVEGQCSVACTMGSATCAMGYDCYATDMGDHCLRQGGPIGSECMSGDDCRSGACLSIDVCTQSCDTTACPSGYDCLDAGGGMHFCLASAPPPPASTCGCSMQSPHTSWGTLLGALALTAWIALRRARRR